MAFAVIAASLLHLEISCVLEQVVSELSALLKKANQPLRQATHGTLSTLIVGYGDKIAMTLVKSSLLQGQALQALQEFFAVLVRSANKSFDELRDTLVSTAKTSPEDDDSNANVVSLGHITLVMRGDLAKSNEILPSIPKEHHNSYRHRVA
ncbi:Cullin-associated NEDD8-dissociated protein 1 [Orobanche minor]